MKWNFIKRLWLIVSLSFLTANCNLDLTNIAEDISNGTDTSSNSTIIGGATYTIGGSVTGLLGTGLILQDLNTDNLIIASDGPFTFASALTDATPYDVTVLTQPSAPSQTCTVTGGTGILTGANISDVVVNCTTNSYVVSGTITGLQGSGLVLQNNGVDDLNISVDGNYSFVTPLLDQSTFNVTILSQPILPNQYCTVSSGSGTISGANPNGYVVNCTTNTYTIGGTVTGLSGGGLVLQNNGVDDLFLTSSGTFTFAAPIVDGTNFNVTVLNNPTNPNQLCTSSGASGIVSGGNISSVIINCTINTYSIGGTVTGLSGTGLVLQNNSGDNLSIASNGTFNFSMPIVDGANFNVTVFSDPTGPNQVCTPSGATGIVSGGNVSSVVINCSTNTYTIGGTVTGLAGTGLVLQNNGSDDVNISANGSFSFATPLFDNAGFNVSVLSQPTSPWQTCSVLGGSGNLTGSNLTSIAVDCVTNSYNINVTVTGLAAASLVLQNNNTDDLTIASNGSYTFATMLNSGAGYNVTVFNINPASAVNCSVTGGFGNITNSGIQITVSCQNVWIRIAAGDSHTMAIRGDGTLWAWGENGTGQIGDGTTTNKSSPVQIGTSKTWTAISAGGFHSLGIDGGKLYAWGYNIYGQLGDGSTTDKISPVQIGTSNTWTAISASDTHSLGINGGMLFAWGWNFFGQLGDGSTTDKTSPIQIGISNTWAAISAGGYYSLGIDGGKLYAWGNNFYGQLGDGTPANKVSPVQIGISATWTSISAGYFHSIGIDGGKLYAWGRNGYGQIGDGSITDKFSPVQIGISTTWTAISAGGFHSLGIDGGKLFAWGYNFYGQLGDGTTTNNSSPVQIGTSTWTSILAGGYHSLGIDVDKRFAWGWNVRGQLGLGDIVDRLVPTQGP